ncbi:efflux RND transporter periplasmic adaptor subunit [Hydrocarboniphaga sp.]|uniref:efflux RND transporter periplasmic adaptor subunit n=1 Tax=Hydrocarboniphaga sp. TaxID=2033016 RepID=UPI003D0EC537
MQHRNKTKAGASIAIPLVLLALAGCHKEAPPAASARPVAVIAPAPAQGAMVGEAYPGSVRARIESPLSFRVAGKITERRVDIGARVKKGEVLAVLDPVDARLNVEASKAAVASAEADAKLAESEYKRYVDLSERGFVSKSLLDQRANELDLAKARLDQQRSQFAVVRNQAAYTSLIADSDGIVTDIQADAGQVVSAGQAVLGFARDGEREVRISVPEGAAVETLRKATALRISLWAIPGKFYEGRLREIASAASAQTRTHEARVSFVAADDEVKLGMTANVSVGSTPGAASWRLPLSAIGDAQGKPVIWRVQGDKENTTAQPLPVTVVQLLNDSAIVSGDIKPADQVISAGVQLLIPGMPVKAIDRTAPVAL